MPDNNTIECRRAKAMRHSMLYGQEQSFPSLLFQGKCSRKEMDGHGNIRLGEIKTLEKNYA